MRFLERDNEAHRERLSGNRDERRRGAFHVTDHCPPAVYVLCPHCFVVRCNKHIGTTTAQRNFVTSRRACIICNIRRKLQSFEKSGGYYLGQNGIEQEHSGFRDCEMITLGDDQPLARKPCNRRLVHQCLARVFDEGPDPRQVDALGKP